MRPNPIRRKQMLELCTTAPEKIFGNVVFCKECNRHSYNKFGGFQYCDHCQKSTQHMIGSFTVPNPHIDNGCSCYHENLVMKREVAESRLRNDLRFLDVPEKNIESALCFAFEGRGSIPEGYYIKEKAAILRNLLYGGVVFGSAIGEVINDKYGENPRAEIKIWVENEKAMERVFEFLNSDICCAHE